MRKLDLSNEEDRKIDEFASEWALAVSFIITLILFISIVYYISTTFSNDTWEPVYYSILGGFFTAIVMIGSYELTYYIAKWYKLKSTTKKE